MTWTQTTLTIKDAAGTNQPVIAYTDGTNFSFAHPILDNTGAIIAPATQGTLLSVLGALQGATPSGSNIIGKVTTDQTAHGTTDLVAADVTKVGGASFALGQQVAGNSLPVVLSAAQLTSLTAPVLGAGSNVVGGVTVADGSDATVGAKADAAATTDSGTFSLISLFKRSLQTLASILTACQAAIPAGANLIGKVGIDQTTPGTTNNVFLSTPRPVTGNTTTRPANTTAYASGQLVANSTTAGSVTYPTIAAAIGNDIPGTILRVGLKKSVAGSTGAIFRIRFYNSQPTVTNGDGGTYLTNTSGYLGFADVTITDVFTDSAMGYNSPYNGVINFKPATGTQNLYYLIEARAAYTPGNGEVFTPILELAQ
ncbi:hypothetical protein [Zavarzinella formosa]|uniref:hypothetical protein n=1 Tax=Zavarzinella formosa TaxID=360055 RepID=UPI0003064389|nr:hypothetical protein [Zavarzinella formosa]